MNEVELVAIGGYGESAVKSKIIKAITIVSYCFFVEDLHFGTKKLQLTLTLNRGTGAAGFGGRINY